MSLAFLAEPTIAALGGNSGGGVPSASLSMPAISGADSGNVTVATTFTSGAFVLGEGNSAPVTSGVSGLLLAGGIAAALFFWFRK